jgi:hypothetical protein
MISEPAPFRPTEARISSCLLHTRYDQVYTKWEEPAGGPIGMFGGHPKKSRLRHYSGLAGLCTGPTGAQHDDISGLDACSRDPLNFDPQAG